MSRKGTDENSLLLRSICTTLYHLAVYIVTCSLILTGNGENYIIRSLMFCISYPILCGHVARMGEEEPGGKRSLGRPRRRW
jgi:hypothetical protein